MMRNEQEHMAQFLADALHEEGEWVRREKLTFEEFSKKRKIFREYYSDIEQNIRGESLK